MREPGIRSGDRVPVPRRSIAREDWVIVLQLADLVVALYATLS